MLKKFFFQLEISKQKKKFAWPVVWLPNRSSKILHCNFCLTAWKSIPDLGCMWHAVKVWSSVFSKKFLIFIYNFAQILYHTGGNFCAVGALTCQAIARPVKQLLDWSTIFFFFKFLGEFFFFKFFLKFYIQFCAHFIAHWMKFIFKIRCRGLLSRKV